MFRYDCGEGFEGSLIKTVVQLGRNSCSTHLPSKVRSCNHH